jgi:hypothetical protein
MSWLNLYAPTDGVQTVWTAVNAWAVKTDAQDTRTADQRRADALVEICAAALDYPGVASSHGLRPAVTVTIAATTLTGRDDQPVLINGEPVPADLGRVYASDPDARVTYRLVDPTGRILDLACDTKPLRTDSYTPTPRIAAHVTARDPRCIVPGCRRPATDSELDHRTPWPTGDTTAANLQPLCKRHHDMKHHSRWRVQRLPDGTYQWTSPTRHTYRYRPPENPVPEPPPPVTDDEPPPF